MSNVWFTADTHFGHKMVATVIRKYDSAEEHDENLIYRWNEVVHSGDRVYHLGDFSLHCPLKTAGIIKQLNGQIYFVRGNHDNSLDKALKQFVSPKKVVWIKDYHFLKIDGCQVALSHYPFATWRNSCHGSFHAHGHCHGAFPESEARRVDVGVDCWALAPVKWEILKRYFESKRGFGANHHEAEHYER